MTFLNADNISLRRYYAPGSVLDIPLIFLDDIGEGKDSCEDSLTKKEI